MANMEIQKKVETQARHGPLVMLDGVAGGKVKTNVWDLICVWGSNVKDGERTEFNEETLSQMIQNFLARGDQIPIDYNHQSNFAHENGQPAPALGFYSAFAIIKDEQVIGMGAIPVGGVKASPPNPTGMADGLWGYRCEVTPIGEKLLPSFKYLSPTFTPAGRNQQDEEIGYVLIAAAATNTPFQAGTQLTLERTTKPKLAGPNRATARRVKMAQLEKLAKFVGLDADAAPGDIKPALSKKLEEEAAKAMEEENYHYSEMAKKLEEMAKLAEQLEEGEAPTMEEEEDDDPPHVVMRRMAAKFAKMAKMEDDEAKPEAKPELEAKMEEEDDDEDKASLQKMARELGLKPSSSPRQILLAMQGKTVSLDKVGQLEKELAEIKRKQAAEEKAAKERDGLVAFETALGLGRTKEEKRNAFLKAYSQSPDDAEALLFGAGTFPAANLLTQRMTAAGAPLTLDLEGVRSMPSFDVADQKVIRMEALETSATVFGEKLSKKATSMADSKDPKVAAKIEEEMAPGTKGTKFESYERLAAAYRILKRDNKNEWEAAQETGF